MRKLFLILILVSSAAFGQDAPFNNPANWGGTGLMEVPNARVIEDGNIRLGYSQADPFRWLLNGSFGLFPGLEISGRYTEIRGIPTRLGEDFGFYKDKALDLKYQILPETKYSPAIAFGLHDFHGTGLFSAEYLVASRQVYPFDFTVGIGSKRLKGEISTSKNPDWLEKIKTSKFVPQGIGRGGWGLFGGLEYAATDWLNLMVEYNPIDYSKDTSSARGVPEGAEIPFNFGARIKAIPGLQLGISFQRGDTVSFMCHLQSELGKPVLPKRPDPPLWYSVDRRPYGMRDIFKMIGDVKKELVKAGFRNVRVWTDSTELAAQIENSKYLSEAKAAGRALRILAFYCPVDLKRIKVVLAKRRIPALVVSVRPEHLEAFLLDEIPEQVFSGFVEVYYPGEDKPGLYAPISTSDDKMYYSWGVKPAFEPYLNDPAGVFKMRLGIEPYAKAELWTGAEIFGRYNIPVYSDVESDLSVDEKAVKGDAYKYKGTDSRLDRLVFDQKVRLGDNLFAGITAGYLHSMYAGVTGELLSFLGEGGKLAIGIEGQWVKKRKEDDAFGFKEITFNAALLNAFCFIDPIDTTLNLKYGRFLGGDIGWRLSFSREYENGTVFGAWLGITDTDVFDDPYNRDYYDKGVFLEVPVRMLVDYETNRRWRYSLSPWTRDVAQLVYAEQSLWDTFSVLRKGRIFSELELLKE